MYYRKSAKIFQNFVLSRKRVYLIILIKILLFNLEDVFFQYRI